MPLRAAIRTITCAEGIVNCPKYYAFAVFACRRNPHRLSLLAPDLCKGGVSMDFAHVHINQMESLGAATLICNHSKIRCTTATASAYWLGRKSCRGQR